MALLASGLAVAADAELLRCRGIADASARLACYDALLVGSAPAAPRDAPRSGMAAPAAPVPLPKPPQERFGLESQAREAQAELAMIESRIPGRFEGWQAGSRIRLANGQVWQIADASSRRTDLESPKVAIRRGMMGAFFLDIEGDNRSPRVRRVQ